jgi:hypothetical protein
LVLDIPSLVAGSTGVKALALFPAHFSKAVVSAALTALEALLGEPLTIFKAWGARLLDPLAAATTL